MSLGKGLGTSSSQEAKEYFSNLPLHVMDFSWEGAESGEVIEMRPDVAATLSSTLKQVLATTLSFYLILQVLALLCR